MEISLSQLGWNEQLEVDFAAYAQRGFEPARVAAEHREQYRLYGSGGECQAEVSGKMRHLAQGRIDFPAVGDWVVIQKAQGGAATIHAILPRKSKFSRK